MEKFKASRETYSSRGLYIHQEEQQQLRGKIENQTKKSAAKCFKAAKCLSMTLNLNDFKSQ